MPNKDLSSYNADKARRKFAVLLELLQLLERDIEPTYRQLLSLVKYREAADSLTSVHKEYLANYQVHIDQAGKLRDGASIAIETTKRDSRAELGSLVNKFQKEVETLKQALRRKRAERDLALKKVRAKRGVTLSKLRRERDSNTKLEKSKASQYSEKLMKELEVVEPLLLEAFDLIEANCNEKTKRERYNRTKKELFIKHGLSRKK